MSNKVIVNLLSFCSMAFMNGCYPVSHILVGEPKMPVNVIDVKIFPDFPESYEKIAIIESSSDFALKDISIDITDQQKTNRALKRLKLEAASLGANGIVIQDVSNKNNYYLNLKKDDVGNVRASTRNRTQKELKATAIFVKNE